MKKRLDFSLSQIITLSFPAFLFPSSFPECASWKGIIPIIGIPGIPGQIILASIENREDKEILFLRLWTQTGVFILSADSDYRG